MAACKTCGQEKGQNPECAVCRDHEALREQMREAEEMDRGADGFGRRVVPTHSALPGGWITGGMIVYRAHRRR